jgi:hypothetical protein
MAPESWDDASNVQWISITGLAKAVGRSPGTIRRWEKAGLIDPAPARAAGTGARLYREADARKILKAAQRLKGFVTPAQDDEAEDRVDEVEEKETWRPTPWAEVIGEEQENELPFSRGTVRNIDWDAQVDALVRRPPTTPKSNSRHPYGRDRGLYARE